MILQIVSMLVSALAIASLLAMPIAIMLAAMLFDAPGSTSSPFTQLLALSILAHPVTVVIGAIKIFGNKQREVRRYTLGLVITLAPTALGTFAAIGSTLLCNGKTSC